MTDQIELQTIQRLLPHVAMRVLDVPLMVSPEKLDTILAVLGPRVGLDMAADLAAAAPGDKKRSRSSIVGDIAVIDIAGTLAHKVGGLDALSGMMSYADIQAELSAAVENPKVAGILLMVDSPGGEVHGAFDLADAIYAAREKKPIVALASETAASAAYLIASAADKLFVAQSGLVGSIGVIAKHIDRTEANAQKGIKVTLVSAGEGKTYMSPDQPVTDESRAYLQQRVDSFYGLFVEKVVRHRSGLTTESVRTLGARMLRGQEGVNAGLADGEKTKEQAFAELRDMAANRPKPSVKKDMSMSKTTLTAEAIAAFTAEHSDFVAAIEASARAAAVASERERIAALTSLAEEGQNGLLSTYIKDGTDVATAALGFSKDRKEKQTKTLADVTGDRPQPVKSPPVDALDGGDAPKISPDAPITERAEAEWASDPKLRTEFAGDKDAYLAWRKRYPN